MRAFRLVCGTVLVLAAAGCQAPSGTLVGYGPPPVAYLPPPPPPVYDLPPPPRCYVQDGPYGPERVCPRRY